MVQPNPRTSWAISTPLSLAHVSRAISKGRCERISRAMLIPGEPHALRVAGPRRPRVNRCTFAATGRCQHRAGRECSAADDQRKRDFRVGGYEVLRKWLQPKHRSTSDPQYSQIVAAIAQTQRLMAQIDHTIGEHGGFPAAFALGSDGTQSIQDGHYCQERAGRGRRDLRGLHVGCRPDAVDQPPGASRSDSCRPAPAASGAAARRRSIAACRSGGATRECRPR